MKITIDRNGDDVHMEVERHPMPESRFRALCILLLATIGGAVWVAVTAIAGFWAFVWGVPLVALCIVRSYGKINF